MMLTQVHWGGTVGDQKVNVEVIGKGAMVSNANRGCSDTT